MEINDEGLMNIVDEVFEEIIVDNIIEEKGGESSDEDQALFDDNDCISDCSENLTRKLVQNCTL